MVNRKKQGDIGVAAAILHYTKLGHLVSIPTSDTAKYDLVVDIGGDLKKVQVKTTNQKTKYDVYCATLSTQGGNQSWNGGKKFITAEQCDLVFVHILNGDSYEFPVDFVANRGAINLGKLCEPYKLCADRA